MDVYAQELEVEAARLINEKRKVEHETVQTEARVRLTNAQNDQFLMSMQMNQQLDTLSHNRMLRDVFADASAANDAKMLMKQSQQPFIHTQFAKASMHSTACAAGVPLVESSALPATLYGSLPAATAVAPNRRVVTSTPQRLTTTLSASSVMQSSNAANENYTEAECDTRIRELNMQIKRL